MEIREVLDDNHCPWSMSEARKTPSLEEQVAVTPAHQPRHG